MTTNIMDHLKNYPFQVGEVVIVGGNPNVLGEVIDVSDSVQVAVKILTPPEAGKTVYTTRFTYYTTPMPHLTAKEVRERFSTITKGEIKLVEPKIKQSVIEMEETNTENVVEILAETFVEEEIQVEVQKEIQVEKTAVAEEDYMQLSLF